MTATMVADQAELRRLVEFASDVTRLADERADLDHRELIRREWARATTDERADYIALMGQRIAHRMEVLEAAQVACLEAARELIVAEEAVETIRGVLAPLAE